MPSGRRELEILLKIKDEASRALGTFGDNLKKTAANAKVALAAVGAGIGVAVKQAAEFEKSIGNLATLFGEDTKSVKAFEKGLKDMLKVVPVNANELGASAYQVVSAGISDTADALRVLESSAKLGIAGLATTEEATDLLTSALNAFQLSADQADNVSNVLFKTVKAGKTTVSELAQAFGQVAPIAKTAGVSLEELQAATAALTTSGLQTSVAQTQIRQAIIALIKPTNDMSAAFQKLGVASGQELLATSDNLVEAFFAIGEALDGDTEKIAQAFGSVEAFNAVLSLTGPQAKTFGETLKLLKDDVDALTTGVNAQNQTFDKQFQLLKNNLNVVLIELGSRILPVLNNAIGVVIPAIQRMSDAINNAGGISALVREKFVSFLQIIEENTGAITILRTSFENVIAVLQEYLIPVLIRTFEILQPLVPFIEVLAKVLGVVLYGALIVVVKLLEGGLIVAVKILSGVLNAANDVLAVFIGFWEKVFGVVMKVVDAISTLIAKIKQLNVVQRAGDAISGVLGFGKRATGGPVQSGAPYMVGERGPELFVPNNSGRIVPNHRLGGAGAGASVNVTIQGGTFVAGDGGVRDLAQMIGNMLVRELNKNMRIST